jgi:hypothetical protein
VPTPVPSAAAREDSPDGVATDTAAPSMPPPSSAATSTPWPSRDYGASGAEPQQLRSDDAATTTAAAAAADEHTREVPPSPLTRSASEATQQLLSPQVERPMPELPPSQDTTSEDMPPGPGAAADNSYRHGVVTPSSRQPPMVELDDDEALPDLGWQAPQPRQSSAVDAAMGRAQAMGAEVSAPPVHRPVSPEQPPSLQSVEGGPPEGATAAVAGAPRVVAARPAASGIFASDDSDDDSSPPQDAQRQQRQQRAPLSASAYTAAPAPAPAPVPAPKKKGFWKKAFGKSKQNHPAGIASLVDQATAGESSRRQQQATSRPYTAQPLSRGGGSGGGGGGGGSGGRGGGLSTLAQLRAKADQHAAYGRGRPNTAPVTTSVRATYTPCARLPACLPHTRRSPWS